MLRWHLNGMGGLLLVGVLAVVALRVVSSHKMGEYFNCVSA